MEKLAKVLVNLDKLSTQVCDQATSQFKELSSNEFRTKEQELNALSRKEDRLDEFFYNVIGIRKYKEVSFVLQLLLILSHGQASVEQVFSHNNTVLQSNMTAETIVTKCLIKDRMPSLT